VHRKEDPDKQENRIEKGKIKKQREHIQQTRERKKHSLSNSNDR
jgi:hypothetical protein